MDYETSLTDSNPLATHFSSISRLESDRRGSKRYLVEIESFFTAIKCCSAAPEPLLRSIATFLRDKSYEFPEIRHLLIDSITEFENPKPFLDVLSSMLCMVSAELLKDAIHALINLIKADNCLLLSALGVMAELQIPAKLIGEVTEIAYAGLSIVNEDDFPAFFRMILISFLHYSPEKILPRLRREVTRKSKIYCLSEANYNRKICRFAHFQNMPLH